MVTRFGSIQSGIPAPKSVAWWTRAVLQERLWPRPPIFDLVAAEGKVARDEMFRTFNMGLGLVAIVAAGDEQATHAALRERGLEAWTVGGVERGEGEATCEVLP